MGTDWREFVEPWWLKQIEKIEAVFVDGELPADFLHAPTYADDPANPNTYSLFGHFGIVNHWSPGWRDMLASTDRDLSMVHDPAWGGLAGWRSIPGMDPGPPCDPIPFSPTLVERVERVSRTLDAAGVDRAAASSAVQWGGGIGLESLLMRWWGVTHTEYIIDLPVMSRVQHAYLGHELGFDQVHHATDTVEPGVINLVPLSSIDLVPQGCDFFMAHHSLNESTVAAQRYVTETREWFGADRLVLEWTENHPSFMGSSYWEDLMRNAFRDRAGVVSMGTSAAMAVFS